MQKRERSGLKSHRLNSLRSLVRFFIYSNFYIALIAVLMTVQTSWLFNGEISRQLLLFTGFATLSSYSFHYYLSDHSVLPSPRVKWTLYYRYWILTLFILGTAGAAWYGWRLWYFWPWLIPAVIATFLYSAPKIPQRHFRILRKVAIGKTIFLAFIWMYVTAVLPLVVLKQGWTDAMRIYCIGQFFFIYAICILFDIRDREDDKADGVRSLITFLNTANIKRLFYFSLGITTACAGVLLLKGLPLLYISLLLVPVFTLFFIYNRAVRDFSDPFYYFFLDGLMALSALLIALTRI